MWDFAAIAGYAAGALAVTLVIYPLRRPGLAKGRRSSLWQHRQLGWAALGFALVHVALLLASQPLTARYLLPSAPLYMLCGIGGLIALGLLTSIASLMTMRPHSVAWYLAMAEITDG